MLMAFRPCRMALVHYDFREVQTSVLAAVARKLKSETTVLAAVAG